MSALKIRQIDLKTNDSKRQIAKIREQFHHSTEVVSAHARKLTQSAFGKAMTPAEVVEKICTDVKNKGLAAVQHYTELLDKIKIKADHIRVKESELAAAHDAADPAFLDVIRRIRYNIDSFQSGLIHQDAELRSSGQHELSVRHRPLQRVGVYCPGGSASYPSALLMTICPAQSAGVKEIMVCMPPTAGGASNKDMLAVCYELGVKEVYRIGGAQAIAAMAYGIEGLAPVEMICGPGNQYVALAKKFVFGTCAIDCIAGPSEVIVAADDSAHPNYVALDLIAQAEHSPGVPILVTWYEPLLKEVHDAIVKRMTKLTRADLAKDSLERHGAFILAPDKQTAIDCINALAPEHLHIQTRDPDGFAEQINNAGAIFLGPFTPVALGDYAAGPSHVLPTGGTARFSSGLTVNDFRKRTSILRYTRNGLRDIAEDVIFLAKKEGLTGHAASVEQRANDSGPAARPKPKPEKVIPAVPAKK
ncbi:histidinol dehydrogenase [soil metagenome]